MDLEPPIDMGPAAPAIIALPHLFMPADHAVVRAIQGVTGDLTGLWGNARPLVTADGDAYLEPEDSQILDEFSLWSLPANQEHALDHAARLPGFVATIPADTPVSALKQMYTSDIGDDQYEYDKCMAALPLWMTWLKWAYVPLEPEACFALFICGSERSSLVDDLAKSLHAMAVAPLLRGEATPHGIKYSSV